MRIAPPWITDLDLVCYRCRRAPAEITEYVTAATHEQTTPEAYVWAEEGTLDRSTGRFCCTECYIAVGMPTGPKGWKAP